MNNQSDFLYTISGNSNNETINANNNYLEELLNEVEKYYSIPNKLKGIKMKSHLNLGNIAFYLLDLPNLKFDKDVLRKKDLLNIYLSYCINDNRFCNVKIFLSFVRDIMEIGKIPEQDLYSTNYYTKNDNINDLTIDGKLKVLLNNVDYINLNKSFWCRDIIDLCIISIAEIFIHGYSIKRCRNCHKYFFNKQSNKYCPYTSPQDSEKSCFEYNQNLDYVKKRKNDPIRNQFNRISNMLRSRWNYSNDDTCRQELLKFSDEYNKMKLKLDTGKISKEDMLIFLDYEELNYKEQYKRREKNGSKRNSKK